MPLWIAVPADQKRAALSALIDADITVHTTREGPDPSDTPPRDPGQIFLSVAFGLNFLGLGAWGVWEGGWWIIPAILSALLGLICISASLARPKNQKPTGEVSSA